VAITFYGVGITPKLNLAPSPQRWRRVPDHGKNGGVPMKPFSTALIVTIGAGLGIYAGLGAHQAHASACSEQITKLETALREAGGPPAGLTANQSIDAQLSHQPTPSTIARAREEAQAQADDVLMRAKELDASGQHAECLRAVKDARVRFGLD
jgi:hypothetical protein